MAGIRFQTTVFSYNSWSYFVQIWDRNYTGSTITEITLGQGGPQINWDSDNDDRFSTIMSSSCEIPIMVEGTLLENWLKSVRDSYEEKDVYVHIYRNTQATASSLIWSGFLLMDLNSSVDEFFPYEFKLTFTDGLSLLKEVDFVETAATKPYDSSEMLWGPASYSFWMKTILGKVGAALTTEGAITDWEWRTSINWYNTGHGTSAPSTLTFDPFAKTEVQVSMFHNEETEGVYEPRNCYDVLNELLKHWGARIVYWRHKFWIIQIPEYNTAETGTLANPDNINTRKYFHSSNSVSDAFDNLNDYWTPYQVFLQASGVIGPSKIVGTKYDFKAPIKEVIAKYITGSGENYFGGFPTSENTVVTGVRINNLADATNIYLDIPLKFTQNRANVNSALTGGQFSSFTALIYYQLAATNLAHGGSTTLFLHYNSSNNSYFWNANPPSTTRPYWYASNLSFQSGSTGVMTQQLGGPDNGAAILIPTDSSFTGVFDITIQIFNFVNGVASNKYAFIDDDSFANWADPTDIGLSWENVPSVSGTTISSSSYVSGGISIVTYYQGNGNPFAGQLLPLSTNNQIAATAQNIIQNSNNTNNSSIRNFNELLWGDSPASVSRGAIEVIDTSGTRTTTLTSGQWGVGVTNGTQTFSKLLLDRFLEGQLTSIRVANFRLVIPTDAKDKDDGTAVRPQYINPVGLLVENRPQEPPMSYVMQRGTFHILMDEWDFQGFEIQSESTSASTVTVTDSNFGTIDIPVSTAPPSFLQRPPSSSINSAARNNIITTLTTAVSGLGSDLVANGNYDELSSELVTNGDFATDSDWTKSSGATISDGKANIVGDGSSFVYINQPNIFTNSGSTYKVTADVVITSGLGLKFQDGVTNENIGVATTTGSYTFYFTAGSNSTLVIGRRTGGTAFVSSVDNVSVKQVDPDNDWTKGTGWSIQDDQAQFSGSADAALEQAGVFTEGTKYKVSIDVAEISGGELEVKDQTTTHQTISSAGGYEFTFTAANTALQLNVITGSVERTIKINSITAQEVSSTTSLSINSIGEAIFATGDKFSLLNINNNTTYDLTINANQSASDTTLTITSFDFEAIVPVGSIVTFNKKNLIKQYQDDTLQEVTDNGNTTTNSIMIGSSSAPSEKLHVTGDIKVQTNTNAGVIHFGDTSDETKIVAYDSSESSPRFDFFTNSTKRFTITTSSIIFSPSGSELMRLTSTGLGIGLTNPATKLEISGHVRLSSNGDRLEFTNANVGLLRDSNNLVLGGYDNIIFRSQNTGITSQSERMRLTSAGRLGIGLTNVISQLHVFENSTEVDRNAGITIEQGGTGDATIQYLLTGVRRWVTGIDNSDGDSFKISSSEDLNSDNVLTLTTGGNVLIGTTTDDGVNKLQVSGNIVSTQNITLGNNYDIKFKNSVGNAVGVMRFNSSNELVIFNGNSPNGDILFKDGGATGTTNLMIDGATGNVLIGTTTDDGSSKLQVDGNATLSGSLTAPNATFSGNLLAGTFRSSRTDGDVYIQAATASDFVAIGTQVSGQANLMRVLGNGNVLIGTTSDQNAKLVVEGTTKFGTTTTGIKFAIAGTDEYKVEAQDVAGNAWNSLHLKADGNDGLFIEKDTNNVGIGLTNPSEILNIAGNNPNIRIDDTSASDRSQQNSDLSFYDSTGAKASHIGHFQSANLEIRSLAGDVSIGTFAGTIIYLDGSNVGISKTSPETTLDVNGTCTSELLQLKRQESTPSEPNEDRSIIFMDAEGDIKVMINVGGTVVTRTLATFDN